MPRLTPSRSAIAVVLLAAFAFASSAFSAVTVQIDCTAPNLTPITFNADIGETVTFQMANPSCDLSGGWEFANGNGLYYGAEANVTEAGYMTLVGHNGSFSGNTYRYSSDWWVHANSPGDTTITTTLGATDGAGTTLVPGATVAGIDTALSSWGLTTGVQNPIVWSGPRTAPTAPISVSAVAGDAAAVVSWSAPESDGGSAITGYTVTARPGGATCQTATTTCTVTGLSNGTAYTVSVIARNEIGPSPASADSAPVTPFADSAPVTPSAPAAESPVLKETGGTATTATPSVYLSQSQRRNGIPVNRNGDVRITLQRPVGGAACAMTGTFTTTSPAARSGMSSFATSTTLGSFKNVRVPAGSTKAITVRLFATPLHYLQANGATTIGAVLTIRRTLGCATTSSSQKVRLRIARVRIAVTG
ncbi:MAG: fibronectin type III domain-containing protein [Miltoncostaeaceae bacterium]